MINHYLLGKVLLIALMVFADCQANEAMVDNELLNLPQQKVKYQQFNWHSLFSSLPQLLTENDIDDRSQTSLLSIELAMSTASILEYRGYIARGNKRWGLISTGEKQIAYAIESGQLLLGNIRVIEIHPKYIRLEQHFWQQEESQLSQRTFVLNLLSTVEEKHIAD